MYCCVAVAAAAPGPPQRAAVQPSPDYFSPCLRRRRFVALPPSPSLPGPVSLGPSPRVAQPRGRRESSGRRAGERRLGGAEGG